MSNTVQRNTKQRIAIAKLLEANPVFYSAQDVHDILATSQVKIGLSTVYRILNQMVTVHEVDIVVLDDGQTLYRRCSTEHHHHLRCRKCGKAVELMLDDVESFAKKIGKQHAFTKIEHTIEISGICAKCSKTHDE